MRYWYALEFGFADLGGNTIDEAIQTAKRDIDNVKGPFGAVQIIFGAVQIMFGAVQIKSPSGNSTRGMKF